MRSSAQNTSSTISGMMIQGQIAGRRSRAPGGSGRASAAIESHQLGFAERCEVHIEADERRRRLGRHVELLDLERIEAEVVAMRLSRWRTRSAVSRCAEVGAALHR